MPYAQTATTKTMYVNATGIAIAEPAFVICTYLQFSGAGGDLIFRNGGAQGVIGIQLKLPATEGATRANFCDGVLFNTDVHVTVPAGCSATFTYNLVNS